MKKIILIALVALGLNSMASDVYVNGYYKSNGTYVDSYHRSSPNDTVTDNYGYKNR